MAYMDKPRAVRRKVDNKKAIIRVIRKYNSNALLTRKLVRERVEGIRDTKVSNRGIVWLEKKVIIS